MNSSRKIANLPPGPKGLPFIGSLLDFQRDPLDFLTRLAKEYGDVASFRLGSKLVVQLNHPDLIRDVLVTNHGCFIKTGVLRRAERILGNGLVSADGELHRRQRRLMQPALNRQRVLAYADVVTESTTRFIHRWEDGQTIDMAHEMLNLTLQIVARALFSMDIEAEAAEIESALTTVLEHFNNILTKPHIRLLSRLNTPLRRRFEDACRILDDFVYRMIDERRRNQKHRGDVLAMLLLAQDVEDGGRAMTDQQIRDEVMTLLTAGHETIATALAWTWYCLARYPDAETLFHGEIDSLESTDRSLDSDLSSYKQTRMLFSESMRLFPPVWAITRQCVEDYSVKGFTIPSGATVGMTQWVTHRDERFFNEPEQFNPGRWTADAAKRPKYSYFPFGGGPRLCIGEPFSWMEGILVLATIGRSFRFELLDVRSPAFQPLITLRPRNGIPIRVIDRSTQSRNPTKSPLPKRRRLV